MSQDNVTFIKCSNSEIIMVCASVLRRWDYGGCKEWMDGDTELTVYTKNCVPDGQISMISALFPNDIIIGSYRYEGEEWSKLYTCEYRGGKERLVRIEPGYLHIPICLGNKKDEDGIFNKASAYYLRLDKLKKDEKYDIDEVGCTFEYDGADGTKYRVETKKLRDCIAFNIFRSMDRGKWEEIHNGGFPESMCSP